MSTRSLLSWKVLLSALLLASPLLAAETEEKVLLDVSAEAPEKAVTDMTKDQVTVSQSKDVPGVVMEVAAGLAEYPGLSVKPKDPKIWDLSTFERIEVKVTNTGKVAAPFGMNVENQGKWQDAPWNTEEITIEPGETKTLTVTFGTSFGQPGYKLKTEAVSCLRIYTKKTEAAVTLRMESIKACGTAKK